MLAYKLSVLGSSAFLDFGSSSILVDGNIGDWFQPSAEEQDWCSRCEMAEHDALAPRIELWNSG